MSDEAFMRRAIALSREGMEKGSGGPFGAVIVLDGKIVGEGHNRVLETNDPTAHAEVVAIRNAAKALGRFSLEGCEMYFHNNPAWQGLRFDRLQYHFPDGVPIEINANAGAGQIEILGQSEDGLGVEDSYATAGFDETEAGLSLDLDVFMGRVEVRNE